MDSDTLLFNAQADRILEVMLSAKDVTPKERHQLRHLIRHYMKMPHPFTACVRDNTKRFGPERAKRICATLKDIGRGTTKWRKGAKKTKLSFSEPPVVDDSVLNILDEASQDKEFRSYLNSLIN